MTPETASAFKQLYTASLKPGVLDLKTKELIALACGVSRLCEGCVQHHVKAAKAAGATLDEIHAALDVCILMGGGPANVYARKALEYWNAG
jgi:AhpD family alkylhydroperoxidase